MADDKIVHPQEIIRLLGISRSTAKRWIDTGIIPGHRTPGGHRRVLEREFLAAVKRLGIPLTSGADAIPATVTATRANGSVAGGILAIDDNHGFLVTLEVAINSALPHVPFHGATNGFVAGTLVERLRPAVVLLDLQMPGLDGTGVCRWLRESSANRDLHIAALTAHSDDPLRVAAFRSAGGDRVFPKPYDENELIAYIRSALASPAATT